MKCSVLRFLLTIPLATLTALVITLPATAADIDIYSGTVGSGGEPNVLFFIDNTSNWSASNQQWSKTSVTAKCNALSDSTKKATCLGYVTQIFGTETDLVQGRVELRALKLVLNELVCKSGAKIKVNAGLMMLNDAGSVDSNSVVAGYIRHRITLLDSSQCAVVLADLDNIDSKITTPQFKGPSSAEYGTALYEAFKYFGGWTNPAGSVTATPGSPISATGFGPIRYSKPIAEEDVLAFTGSDKTTYKSPITGSAACGNNYIVLIGNKFPNQEYGTDTNSAPNPTNTQMTRLAYDPGAQIYPIPLKNNNKSDVRFADEWAKFLYKTDVSDATGQQNVRMFTVDVYNGSPSVEQGKLLKSIADQTAPGGYFAVNGDLYALITAFTDILTQIAAVDSVFASASLPVSVNAQGTFLNQVFMGVFRPDGDAQQRWVGNLKQYQFALDGETLFLADAKGKSAVDAVNSGFIQHCAQSYWTTDSGTYWQTITGMNDASACDPANNLKPFSDLPDGPMVERGGAGQRLRDQGFASRNIRTCTDLNCTALTDFTATATVTAATGMNATLVNWARGQNNGDGFLKASDGSVTYIDYGLGGLSDLTSSVTRPTVHGEVIHSRPLAVNYGVDKVDNVVVFYGAGDGMLHAVNGNQAPTDGNELWTFIAPEHWSTLDRVRTNSPLIAYPNVSATLSPAPTAKTYFMDGSIGGYQERTSSSIGKLLIYPTMRRGGRAVYAFDVTTKPDTTTPETTLATQPSLLWKYSQANDDRMGESWSTPVAFRVKGMSGPLVAFGAGYDKCEDEETSTSCDTVTKGKGIVVRDAQSATSNTTATNYRFIGVASGELDSSAGRFVADITAVDVDRDGYVDVLYAADTRGNIWRINTSNPAASYGGYSDVSKWPVNKIASVSDWSVPSEKRKFMYGPSVIALGSQATVLVGTGDREKPSADSNAAKVNNRFYGIRDSVTITSGVTPVNGAGVVATDVDLTDLKNVTNLTAVDPTALASYKGWFRELSTTNVPYEQVITTPLTFAGVTYFNTYQAKVSGSNMCANLGTGRAYQIDFQTGSKLYNQPLVTTFVTQGIPPSPVGGVVKVGDKIVPFVIGGPSPSPLSPKKVTPNVRADRKPVYRYQRIDK